MLQTNGQVEQAHQMLMCMIGKLSKDWKAGLAKASAQVGACLQFYRDQPSPDTAHII